MTVEERDPRNLIREGYFERCPDFKHEGRRVWSSRLGYRMTSRFVRTYFGRMFNHPHLVLTEEMLKPELQDMAVFADGMENIIATQKLVAGHYFHDGSVEWACPPLRALLHVMLHDHYEGQDLNAPELRSLFTRENLLSSSWYEDRLKAKQRIDLLLGQRHLVYVERFLAKPNYADEAIRLGIRDRRHQARQFLERVKSPAYLDHLRGTIGAEPRVL